MGDILSPINVDELTLAVKSLVGNPVCSPLMSDDLDELDKATDHIHLQTTRSQCKSEVSANASMKSRTSYRKPLQKRNKERKKSTVVKAITEERANVTVPSSQSATRLPCFLSMVPQVYVKAANKRQESSKSNTHVSAEKASPEETRLPCLLSMVPHVSENITDKSQEVTKCNTLLPAQKVSSNGMLLIVLAKLVDSSEGSSSSQADATAQTVPDNSVSRSATHTHEDILPESCLNNINTEDFIPVHSQQATQSDHDKDEQNEDFPPSAYSDQSQPVVSQTFNFDDYYHSCQMTDAVGSLSHQAHNSCQLVDAVESMTHSSCQLADAVETLSHQSHNTCPMRDAVDSHSHQSHMDQLAEQSCISNDSNNNPVAHSGPASATISHDQIYSTMSHYDSHSQASRSQICQEVHSSPSSVLSLLPTLCNPHSTQLIDGFDPSHHQAVDTSNSLLHLASSNPETGRSQGGATFLQMAQRSNVVSLPTLSNFNIFNINTSSATISDYEIPRDTTPYAALENLVMNATNHSTNTLQQSTSALNQSSLQNLHSQLDQSATNTLHEATNHVEGLPIQSSTLCLPETANRSSFHNLSSLINPVIGGCVWSPQHADSDSGISTDASAQSPNLSVIDFILKTHQTDLDLNRDSSHYASQQQHIPTSHYTNAACNGQFTEAYEHGPSQLHEASLNTAALGQPLQHVSTEYAASTHQNGHVTTDVILAEQNDSDDKETTYCVICNDTYLGPCKSHPVAYSHFEDTSILSRARASLPSVLYLEQSTVTSNREGVRARDQLACFSKFGPLVGQYKPRGDYKLDGRVDEFVWKIYYEGEYELILTEDEERSNWMRFVQQAKSQQDINVMAYQQGREIYFVTCRPIGPHQELCFWFGKEFTKVMGVPIMPGHRARCALCNITFSTPKAVRQHVRNSHHSGETKILRCTMCEQTFKKTYELREHTLGHMGVQPHHCRECGKSFQSRGTFRKHVRKHRGVSFPCVVCNKSFGQKAHLQSHMLHHTGQKAFRCSYCTCRFSRKSDMHTHENTHTHKNVYNCVQCGKDFYKHASYKKHLMVHAVQRDFICQKCDKSFYRRYHLDRHSKTCRKIATPKAELYLNDAELDLQINLHAAAAAAAASAAATTSNDVNI